MVGALIRGLVCFDTNRALDVQHLYNTVCDMTVRDLPVGAWCSTRRLPCTLIVLVLSKSMYDGVLLYIHFSQQSTRTRKRISQRSGERNIIYPNL